VKGRSQSQVVSPNSLLVLLGIVSVFGASVAGVAAAFEAKEGPRGALLLLGYSVFGYTAFGVATTLTLRRSRRLASSLAISWLGIPRISWIVGAVGLAVVIVLITYALTYGSAPAS